jgi:hypothetical protein
MKLNLPPKREFKNIDDSMGISGDRERILYAGVKKLVEEFVAAPCGCEKCETKRDLGVEPPIEEGARLMTFDLLFFEIAELCENENELIAYGFMAGRMLEAKQKEDENPLSGIFESLLKSPRTRFGL